MNVRWTSQMNWSGCIYPLLYLTPFFKLSRTQRLHAALATVVRLCPKGKTELYPVIAANAPFRLRPCPELVWYYRQSLQVLRYIPLIQGHVLELLIEKSLEMDVEIKVDDGGEATIDEETNLDVEIFQLDLDEAEERTVTNKVTDGVTVDEMADKLDCLLLLLFEYTEASTSGDVATACSLYQTFSRAFESSVLITHKSKFVQFLLLHVCGLESKAISASSTTWDDEPATLYRDFAAKLIDVIVDPYRATVTRQTGACYLASFVSRASFVCSETVCESVCALLRWAEAYVLSLDSLSVHAADAREQCNLHSLFYTVCQSAFYIMCFRGADAVEFYRKATESSGMIYAEPEHIDIGTSRWTKLCAHPLQPLRYCLGSVRTEFLEVSQFYRLVDGQVLKMLLLDDRRCQVSSQLRKRKATRIATVATLERLRLSGGVGGLGRGANPLDSFFPFDPYLLRRSHFFIEPFYNHWNGSVTETAMQDDEDDDDDDEADCAEDVLTDDEADNSGEDDADSESHADDGDRRSDAPSQPLSFASNAASFSSKSTVLFTRSPEVAAKREELGDAWTETLKRSRAPSIENGSW
jgi:RNA polymerase I-specific transcription initiation factor RRN3